MWRTALSDECADTRRGTHEAGSLTAVVSPSRAPEGRLGVYAGQRPTRDGSPVSGTQLCYSGEASGLSPRHGDGPQLAQHGRERGERRERDAREGREVGYFTASLRAMVLPSGVVARTM